MTPSSGTTTRSACVHGGVAATLLDSCMGCAVQTHLPSGSGSTTLEIKVNFVRALTDRDRPDPRRGRARCMSDAVPAPRKARSSTPRARCYAHGTTTCMVFPI